jgi:radical SAM superfamily enzyme YgiQ (UPF0313 family)
MPEVVITCDWTMMSDHHGKEFLGFGTTTPAYIFPEAVYAKMFYPKMQCDENGYPRMAPYGMRKIEASLMDAGFDARIVHPSHLNKYMPGQAKVLLISGHDYFGLNPPSSTFGGVMHKEPLNSVNFKRMLTQPAVVEARKQGLKIIAGGPCAWQLAPMTRLKLPWIQEFVDSFGGIDTVVEGEADLFVREIVAKALRDEYLPPHVVMSAKEAPRVDQISSIRFPSVNGLIEIGRGCCRGCSFCSVTTRPTRWYPLEKIEEELKINAKIGVRKGLLHSDDVYFYGSPNVMPHEEKLIPLLKLAKRYYEQVGWSHVAIASLMTKPKLLQKCGEVLLDEKQDWWGVEVGVETGSPRMVTAAMPGKVAPFKASQWPELVVQAAGLMNDNKVYPACTFIVGLPQETEDDVAKTIDLIDDLWDFKAILVPMFFVPLGHLKSRDWMARDRLSPLQEELLKRALTHGLRQSRALLHDFFDWEGNHTRLYRTGFLGFINFLEGLAKLNGLYSPAPRGGREIADPNRYPDRLPVPTIPVRE